MSVWCTHQPGEVARSGPHTSHSSWQRSRQNTTWTGVSRDPLPLRAGEAAITSDMQRLLLRSLRTVSDVFDSPPPPPVPPPPSPSFTYSRRERLVEAFTVCVPQARPERLLASQSSGDGG